MKTALQTGPGLYAADTADYDHDLPPGTMRVYCARIEAYDLDPTESSDIDTNFALLFAQADGNPQIAKALLKLGQGIEDNRANLEEAARQ